MTEESSASISSVSDALSGLSGPAHAAILLMALGEEKAASILKHMEPREVQTLGEAMAAIDGVSQSQIGGILDKFVDKIKSESSLGLGSRDYLKKTLTRALGHDRAGSILGQIQMDGGPVGLESLKWMSPRAVANIVYNEHPQIIAIVLAHLEREQAGKVLDLMPKHLHTDILIRITKLDTIHPSALQELNEIIQRLFEENSETELTGIGGISVAAEILNGVSKEAETEVLEQLAEIDAELMQKIQDSMFIFDNLLSVDDRGMQSLLREVSTDKLILALKGAAQELREKIFRNMSKRAAEMLRDDLEAKGPVRLAEVEEAQKEILTVAMRMSEEGTIALGGKGDDFV
ncbi:MAG: flagellar motor switch protein FliG [Gammaproteobacteria bacterium]|nr:flagellar motor switch protein FliG [Gammaproteobacteria bacterium]